ncbi:MAG TPA: beta-glucosidase [Clostridiaceae bacterium]|nr:beta-glucosidase [Clostridiaceae bacterium]
MTFQKGFIWGAATAAYQIEGAAFEDGKGPSVWDMCCRRPGFVKDGDTGDIACDHYHRYKEDVAIMKEIGLQAYRMSVSWPRVLPDGTGRVNEKGLDFYDKLIDELLNNGIIPYITLFHWDYPYELYKKGGWLNPESPEWFAEYARIVVERLSDRVKHWITLNEPQCFIILGHYDGIHAPGLKLDKYDIFQAIHNTLLAHGRAVETIRQYSKLPCEVGIAPVGNTYIPETSSEKDIKKTRDVMFACFEDNLWSNSWWMDPVYFGKYPEDGLAKYERWLSQIKQDDMKIIHQPLDFFGCNIYQGVRVRFSDEKPLKFEYVKNKPGYDQTAIKWPVTPEALYWCPRFFYERYGKPVLITENGLSNTDWVSVDGKVHDPQRIDFLYRYIKELKRAAQDGVEAKGYFTWSLMDNFEWAQGYNERFGLVHIDYTTQKRTIKDSAYWYKTVIESNGDVII